MGESENLQTKAEILAKDLEQQIQDLTTIFHAAIQEAGAAAGLKLTTKVSVEIES